MKVLMVTDFYPPFIGGSFRHAQILSRSLVRRGHEVVVCSIGNRYLNGFEDDCGVKVIRFDGLIQKFPFGFKNSLMKYPPPVPDFLVIKKLRSIIENEKPDVVHCHGWLLYSVLQLKRQLSFPLVVTLHDYGYMCPKISFFKGGQVCDEPYTSKCITCAKGNLGLAKSTLSYLGIKSGKKKLNLVDSFISVSSFVGEANSKHLNIKKKVVVIPNFCEIKKESFKLAESKILPNDFILFVGSLTSNKGVNVLINAYNKLNTETKLVVIGAAESHCPLKDTKKVTIMKNAPYDKILEAYSKCKFVIVPSIWPEPFGLVVLEGMSHKKAIIASDTGGLSEVVVNGKTGILVPPNDSKKLAKTIQYLLENPSLAHQMGLNGYDRLVKNYTSDFILPKIENVYHSLSQKKR